MRGRGNGGNNDQQLPGLTGSVNEIPVSSDGSPPRVARDRGFGRLVSDPVLILPALRRCSSSGSIQARSKGCSSGGTRVVCLPQVNVAGRFGSGRLAKGHGLGNSRGSTPGPIRVCSRRHDGWRLRIPFPGACHLLALARREVHAPALPGSQGNPQGLGGRRPGRSVAPGGLGSPRAGRAGDRAEPSGVHFCG